MNGPGTGGAGLVDPRKAVPQVADPAVLGVQIDHAITEVVGHGGKPDFQIDRKRFGHSGHGREGLAGPEGTAAEHAENDGGIGADGEGFPERGEAGIGFVVEGVGMAGAVDPLHMVAEDIGTGFFHAGQPFLPEAGVEREVVVFHEQNVGVVAEAGPGGDFAPEAGVTLFVALVVAGAEPGIGDMDFVGNGEGFEIGGGAAMGKEEGGARSGPVPPSEHGGEGGGVLVDEEDVKNAVHGENQRGRGG